MRLWHKDLIEFIPNAQLKGQWNEINAIIGSITKYGYPRHGLVNFIMDYESTQFEKYVRIVYLEIERRNNLDILKYKPVKSKDKINTFFKNNKWEGNNPKLLFENHHNDEYLLICYYNLLEKYNAQLISQDEWIRIESKITNKKT